MAETFLYLTTTGRKTGQPRKIEIWFVQHDGCYYLCAESRENANWVRNIQQQPQVTHYLAEGMDVVPTEEHDGTAQPLPDETDAKVQAVKALFDAKYNWSDGLIVEICPASGND